MGQTQLNASQFIELIKTIDYEVILKDLLITESITLTNNEVNSRAVLLQNCIFYKDVVFESVDFNYGLKLEGCSFKNHLSIYDSKTLFTSNNWDIEGSSVLIQNCKIHELIFHTNNSFCGNITICKQSEINSITVDNLSLTKLGACFKIKESKINGSLTFTDNNWLGSLIIRESQVYGPLYFNNLACSGMLMLDSQFLDLFDIYNGSIGKKFSIEKCKFSKHFQVSAVNSKTLIFDNSSFDESVEISNVLQVNTGGSRNFLINSCVFNNGIRFYGGDNTNNPFSIDEIKIFASNKLFGLIEFFNFSVNKSILTGTNQNATIIFNSVSFNFLETQYFSNFANLQFINVASNKIIGTSLSLKNSILGSAFFSNCLLDSFSNINIESSVLTDIVTANVKWFLPSQILSTGKAEFDAANNRELFRQLKTAMEKQGNRIQALVFKQYEMIEYKKELCSKKGRYGEKTILWLSQSNNFGQAWWKPFYFLIPITLLFAFILLLLFNCQRSDFGTTFLVYKKVFVCLLDPTHSLKTIFGDDKYISGYMYAADILHRLIYAYLVFQIVSAFRKYIK